MQIVVWEMVDEGLQRYSASLSLSRRLLPALPLKLLHTPAVSRSRSSASTIPPGSPLQFPGFYASLLI